MPLPVQRSEMLEHDVKNEREPERSTCPHVPSLDVDRTSFANGQSSVLSDPADGSRMLAFALTGAHAFGQRPMHGPLALHTFAPTCEPVLSAFLKPLM